MTVHVQMVGMKGAPKGMKSFRQTLQGPLGKVIALAIVAVGAVAVYLTLFGGPPTATDIARQRTYIDAESGKPFKVDIYPGLSMPVKSPFTGNPTGVEPELCFWTAEGTAKTTPDYVLLNRQHIPPIPGPTFCPVCHRLVVPHNPSPSPGDAPPMTEDHYKAMHH